MKEVLGTIGSILGILVVLLFLKALFDPQGAEHGIIGIINSAANIWHAILNAFSR